MKKPHRRLRRRHRRRSERRAILPKVFLSASFLTAIALGIAIGLAIATTRNIQNFENFAEQKPSLPSQILDINGELITEFFGSEKREIIAIDEIPKHLIYALITREDKKYP